MVTDIERGMHPRDWNDPAEPLDSARAGVIKMGASYQHVSKQEQRRDKAKAAVASAEASRNTFAADYTTLVRLGINWQRAKRWIESPDPAALTPTDASSSTATSTPRWIVLGAASRAN